MQKSFVLWDKKFENDKPETGLEVDGYIFREIFKPYKTRIEHRAWIDINSSIRLFMEHIDHDALKDRNWFMINQELVTEDDLDLLPEMEIVICKTDLAFRLVRAYKQKHHPNAAYEIFFLSFTSIIRPVSKKYFMNYDKFLHLAGASWMKGTAAVLSAWEMHPEWPTITILCRKYCYDQTRKQIRSILKKHRGKMPQNITLYTELVPVDKVQELLETCGVQILTSEAEGWGHYIHEARAHKALCVYTDFPPMNEFFQKNEGIGVSEGKPIKMEGDLTGADGFQVTSHGVEKAIQKVLKMSILEREKMGINAMHSFYKDRKYFFERANELKKRI